MKKIKFDEYTQNLKETFYKKIKTVICGEINLIITMVESIKLLRNDQFKFNKKYFIESKEIEKKKNKIISQLFERIEKDIQELYKPLEDFQKSLSPENKNIIELNLKIEELRQEKESLENEIIEMNEMSE